MQNQSKRKQHYQETLTQLTNEIQTTNIQFFKKGFTKPFTRKEAKSQAAQLIDTTLEGVFNPYKNLLQCKEKRYKEAHDSILQKWKQKAALGLECTGSLKQEVETLHREKEELQIFETQHRKHIQYILQIQSLAEAPNAIRHEILHGSNKRDTEEWTAYVLEKSQEFTDDGFLQTPIIEKQARESITLLENNIAEVEGNLFYAELKKDEYRDSVLQAIQQQTNKIALGLTPDSDFELARKVKSIQEEKKALQNFEVQHQEQIQTCLAGFSEAERQEFIAFDDYENRQERAFQKVEKQWTEEILNMSQQLENEGLTETTTNEQDAREGARDIFYTTNLAKIIGLMRTGDNNTQTAIEEVIQGQKNRVALGLLAETDPHILADTILKIESELDDKAISNANRDLIRTRLDGLSEAELRSFVDDQKQEENQAHQVVEEEIELPF